MMTNHVDDENRNFLEEFKVTKVKTRVPLQTDHHGGGREGGSECRKGISSLKW
jgi:hypothetical protein